jgi:hypothetical protein
MKQLIVAAIVLFASACNSDGKSSSTEDTSVSNISGVENVNGNMPDTTNSISVDGSSQSTNGAVDTSKKKQ